jgi:hypothetical protein
VLRILGGSAPRQAIAINGLLLVTVFIQCLLRDPLNIQEYALRGAAEHSSDMAAYFAYDTMAGALGHLLILGLAMGVLLGAVGGLIPHLLGFVMRPPLMLHAESRCALGALVDRMPTNNALI